MFTDERVHRLRLIGLAGVLAPAAMAIGGAAVRYLVRGDLPELAYLPGWAALGWALATAVGSLGLVYVVSWMHPALERALRESGVRAGLEALRVTGYPGMLVIVVGAGIGEEILFRGGLQAAVGLIPAALLFGFSHGGWRRDMRAYAVIAAVTGGLFGMSYRLTGDLWVPVVAHAVHNAATLWMMGRGLLAEAVDPPDSNE